MKKALFFALVLSITAGISACKKDRICRCTLSAEAFPGASFAVDTTFTDISKADAESDCDELSGPVTFNGATIDANCRLRD